MLNPLNASDRIREEYREYLLSTFPLRRADLRRELEQQLRSDFALSKGPYLQVSPPFVTGASVRDLVNEGVLSKLWLTLPETAFPIDRPLYLHQETAIRKAKAGRNLVVTTGTGSGKTECFLIPIVDDLMREVETGTIVRPGVRALLLYPMNALANDQLKRLRSLLAHLPAVTFGRYVGDTQATEDAAAADFAQRYPFKPRLSNELISREAMQAAPPRMLLTNYAMLEYLLLRPDDSALFDGKTSGHWQHLALDEVHVYDGAQGAEVAMLLRRLRDRVNGSKRGELQCFGTSATLGGGVHDYPKLVKYAEDLFDEDFAWDDEGDAYQDVVGATRKPLVRADAAWSLGADAWRRVRASYRGGATTARLVEVAGTNAPASLPGDTPERWIARALAGDEQVIALQQRLEAGATSLRDAASHTIGSGREAEQALVDLVDLGVAARYAEDDAPVIPARYHFFLRALEGAFLCLHAEHDPAAPRLLLSRHDQCPSCLRVGRASKMVELGSCRRCGAEYAIGELTATTEGYRLATSRPSEVTGPRLLLGEALADDADDEDENTFGAAAGDKAVAGLLCPGCGAVCEGTDGPQCECAPKPRPVQVAIAKIDKDQNAIRKCLACARRSPGDVVHRFMTGSDAPVSVIATDLYQEIPPSGDAAAAQAVGRGRKLLAFSDSRQDAAFFAPYLERTYNRAIQRRLIQLNVEDLAEDEPCLSDLLTPVRRQAAKEFVIDPEDTPASQKAAVSEWLVRELLAVDRRQTLEGTGMAELRLRPPASWRTPPALLQYGFDEREAEDLIRLLVDTVRLQGALNAPDQVDLRSQAFAPRNLEISIRERQSGNGMLAWMPGRGKNGRLDLIERVFERKGIDRDPVELLHRIWEMLIRPESGWDRVLLSVPTVHGAAYRLDPDRFSFFPADDDHLPGRCDTCSQLWWRSIAGVCPSFRCVGTVKPVEGLAQLKENHYARLYSSLEPIGLSVQEHTAQWVSSEASAIQDKFVRGRINVLSCSTTFELGVDVGEVQAVLLRNVPPSPSNYVQRAGRAGRRTDSAALVVCFAQRRSHDLHFFDQPTRMVDGIIPPPQVPLTNVPIVRRHVHSVAFAAYQRHLGAAFKSVEDFFIDADSGATHDNRMVDWLREKPLELFDALQRIVPSDLQDLLGLEDWEWVEALVQPTDEQPTFGWLARAGTEVRSDGDTLEELREQAAEEQNYKLASHLQSVRKTLVQRYLLNFLASRNVLPKYGFPVDVVELSLGKTGDPVAAKLELSRDLSMAIRDYAPGAQVVAGKALWLSKGLALRRGQTWPTYHWAICSACGAFRQGLEDLPSQCPSCKSEADSSGGKFIIPIHGFVGAKAAGGPGESQPRKPGYLETFFGSYGGDAPELVEVAELSSAEEKLLSRFSHQGQITVLNRGTTKGFHICAWCGAGAPAASRKKTKEHDNPQRPGVKCNGSYGFVQLGHRFLTDVVELRLAQYMDKETAVSGLNALVAAVPELGIKRDDIDGALDWYAQGRSAFVLYDAVPGGAGHALELNRRLPELFEAALAKVSDCECGEETSCYGCLRSYSNQHDHEHLSRGAAKHVLQQVLDAAAVVGTGR